MPVSTSLIGYLKKLKKNNNRPWFKQHKSLYDKERKHFIVFCDEVERLLNEHDVIASKKIYRIYRDIRFSKDKTPYKDSFSCHFERDTAARRGGYYLEIKSGASFIAGGFWAPNAKDLKRIRQEFVLDPKPILSILADRGFKKHFGTLKGSELKTAPRGFDVNDPNIALIRKKQFVVIRSFTDDEVLSADFDLEINKTYKQMRPFFDYMSQVLTTDLNGVSLIE